MHLLHVFVKGTCLSPYRRAPFLVSCFFFPSRVVLLVSSYRCLITLQLIAICILIIPWLDVRILIGIINLWSRRDSSLCKEEEENGRRDEKKFLSLRKFIIVTDEVIPIKTIVGSLSHHILSYKLFHEYISNNHSFKDTFFLIRRGKIRNIIIQHFQNFSVLSRICVIKQRLLRLNIQYFARINPLNINNCSNHTWFKFDRKLENWRVVTDWRTGFIIRSNRFGRDRSKSSHVLKNVRSSVRPGLHYPRVSVAWQAHDKREEPRSVKVRRGVVSLGKPRRTRL